MKNMEGFSHVCDVKCRKMVERTLLNVGALGLRTARMGATVIHTKHWLNDINFAFLSGLFLPFVDYIMLI